MSLKIFIFILTCVAHNFDICPFKLNKKSLKWKLFIFINTAASV